MKTTQEQDNAPKVIQQKGNKQASAFKDGRSETVMQTKLYDMVNNSEQVTQMQSLQRMADNRVQNNPFEPIQRKENNTGLPNNLKSGIENLSGHSMDDVKVHYNSDKPAQLQAHAYAQGTDIHVASGQEKHLPHEAWHVVQQKQGRVKPTMQMKGKVNVNDDSGLEREADVMGAKALNSNHAKKATLQKKSTEKEIVQRVNKPIAFGRLNTYTKRLEKAIRAGNGNDAQAASLSIYNADSAYYLKLYRYKFEKHKDGDKVKYNNYSASLQIAAIQDAWDKRGSYYPILEAAIPLLIFTDTLPDRMAVEDPSDFVMYILNPMKQSLQADNFLRLLERPDIRNSIRDEDNALWFDLIGDIPQFAVSEGVYQEILSTGLDLTDEQIIDRIFNAMVSNEGIDVGYYTNNLTLDSGPTNILKNATIEETAARLERARQDATKPSKPSLQCDNLMKVLHKVVEMYPNLDATFGIGMERQALLTVPLDTLNGGLIPNTFEGNVVDIHGDYTNQIFFTGVVDSEEPRSHTWNIINGKSYDSVLGTKGDGVAGSIQGSFTQRRNEEGYEKVWESGERTLTLIRNKTAATNSMGFNTAYQRNW